MRYCLSAPTMVLAFKDNHQAAVTVPSDTIITVIGPAEDDRFVVVVVGDEQFLMFESDLKDRGKLVGKPQDRAPTRHHRAEDRQGIRPLAKLRASGH